MLLAAGMVLAAGAEAEAVFSALKSVRPVRGRMELAATRANWLRRPSTSIPTGRVGWKAAAAWVAECDKATKPIPGGKSGRPADE